MRFYHQTKKTDMLFIVVFDIFIYIMNDTLFTKSNKMTIFKQDIMTLSYQNGIN